MADLTIVAANVIAGGDAVMIRGKATEAITAGQVVYRSGGSFSLAEADDMPEGVQVFIALNGAAQGQPMTALQSGSVAMGSVFTAGTSYYLSGNAGAIAPFGDLGTGDDVVFLGVATSATQMQFAPIVSGVTLP